jgi:S-layer protein (TIGR01567 family)
MKSYTSVLLAALAVLIAVASLTASAADNVNNITNAYDIVNTNHEWEPNEQYPVIELFGEKDVPLFTANGNIWDAHINKLAKLVLDNGADYYTLKEGEKLDLSQGYALEAKQINIDGMKVWLEFTKDGKHIADQIISTKPDSNKTWTVALDNVQGENNVVVMKVHIDNLFAGAIDNIVRIDGLWLIDYANARTIKVGDNIRKIPPYDGVYVNANLETIKVGDKIGDFTLEKIVSGTNESNMGSLVFKNTTGSSVTCNVTNTSFKCGSWSNIAADTAIADDANAIDASKADNDSSITNICDVVSTNYKWEPNAQYPVIDLFGEKNVPLFTANGKIENIPVNKLSKLIVDSNEPQTLKEGGKLDLGNGYALEAKQINIRNREAWLEFTKDGQHVADKIVSSLSDDNITWNVALNNVQDENNILVMRVHVDKIGGLVEDNIVKKSYVNIDGIWLTDYANARTLKIGDEIGEFKLKKIVSGSNITNKGSLTFENISGSSVTCNVVSTNYKCDSWSSQYPLINLFGETDVPLLADNDPIWKCHVNKLAKLVLDSSDKHALKTGDNLDLGQGYSIHIKEIDVPGKKVWIEFDIKGQYVDDSIISKEPGYNIGTCSLNKVQDESEISVLKVYVRDVYQEGSSSIVQIDGIWLIDYANARTLKIGDKVGEYTLGKIVSGTNSSNLGSLAFKKTQTGNSASSGSEKKSVASSNMSAKSSIAWLWDFWGFFTAKAK